MGTHSKQEINENSDLLQGMIIKLITTYTGTGCAAPLCAAVRGLNENELLITNEELKESKGMFVLKVEGLSAHRGVGSINKQSGHTMFMRSSKNEEYNVDQARCDCYDDETHVPFVESIRELNHRHWTDRGNMLPKTTNVGWSDGDICQISNALRRKVSENDKSKKLLE